MKLVLEHGWIDLEARSFHPSKGEEVRISPNEAKLLGYLAQQERYVDQRVLLVDVFDYAPGVESRTVVTTVHRLRRKIERDPTAPRHLLNDAVRGYRLVQAMPGFVGRQAELDDLRRRLEAGIVGMVAPGGYGKTTLVRRYVRAHDDVLWLDVTEITHLDGLLEVAARALGLSRLPSPEAAGAALRQRAASLVVVDAAEDLPPEALEAVVAWHLHTPLLITSRRPLPGVPTVVLGPLPAPDAERLLARDLDEPLEPTHRALLHHLQGVPLAIEVAAARLRTFTADDLVGHVDELQRRLPSARQGSLDAVLAWSWERLPDDLQAAAIALAPCQGGARVTDAVALVGAHGLQRIDRLAQWGWVQVDESRVRMLDPLRRFLARHNDLTSARRDHLARFTTLVAGRSDDVVAGRWRSLLQSEWANLRAAFRTGIEQGDPRAVALTLALFRIIARLPMSVSMSWVDDALAVAEPGDQRASLLLARAKLWLERGSLDLSERDLDAAEADGHTHPGMLAYRRGQLAHRRGQLEDARAALTTAVATLQGPWALYAELSLVFTMLKQQDFDASRRRLSSLISRARTTNVPPALQVALGTLGALLKREERYGEALAAYGEALSLHDDVGDDVNQLRLLSHTGDVHFALGELDQAEERWRQAIAQARRLNSRVDEGLAMANLGGVELARDDPDAAEAWLRPALTALDECGRKPPVAYACLLMGQVASLRRAWPQAQGWWARAEPDLPVSHQWILAVERSVAACLAGSQEVALAPPATPPSTQTEIRGRRLAEGFIALAYSRRVTARDERTRLVQEAEAALAEAGGGTEPYTWALGRRLRSALHDRR